MSVMENPAAYNGSRLNKGNFVAGSVLFAEGSFRLVYKTFYRSGPAKGQKAVRKTLKSGTVFSAQPYEVDLRTSAKALTFIDAFNNAGLIDERIKINVPEVWKAVDHFNERGDPMRCIVEPFIEGYEKFNSNSGWNDVSTGWGEAMQALSHFSYHVSGGECLLCDLQGGVYEREIILTDPVVLSRDGRFGVTDLGPDGIQTFFAHHRCNRYCDPRWARPRGVEIIRRRRGTTAMSNNRSLDH